jgi:HEPN domain-containing protein
MKLTAREQGDRWLRQAKQDLDDAQYAHDGGRFHLTCFLAQQSAEKALKAFLYSQGQMLVLGHSVGRLCQNASKLDAEFAGLGKKAAPLDKYYITTRYPNGLPDGIPAEAFDAVDAEHALELTKQVIAFVQTRLVTEDENTK